MKDTPQTKKAIFRSLFMTCCCLALLGGCATAPKLPPNAGPIEREIYSRYAQLEDKIGDKGFHERATLARQADAGDADALRQIGTCFLEDLWQPVLALQAWQKAIEHGDAEACQEAGRLFLSKAYGVPRDPAVALNYFATALYLPITTSNLTEIRSAGDLALATALFEFNQPQWPQFQQVLERYHELDLSIFGNDYAALSVLDPGKFPPNDTVRQVLRSSSPSRNDILRLYKDAGDELKSQVTQVRELYESERNNREDLARIDAANRQQIGEAFQSFASNVAQGQATYDAARGQATAITQQANRPPTAAIRPVFLNATAGTRGSGSAGGSSMRELYLKAAQLCREAAAKADNPADRARWEQASRENQKSADALLSNAPALDRSEAPLSSSNPVPLRPEPQPTSSGVLGGYATPAK